jgi:hypothetical protein
VNSAPAGRTFDEPNGNLTVEEKIYDLLGIAAVDGELYARVLFEKGSNEPGEHILGDRRRNAERELA